MAETKEYVGICGSKISVDISKETCESLTGFVHGQIILTPRGDLARFIGVGYDCPTCVLGSKKKVIWYQKSGNNGRVSSWGKNGKNISKEYLQREGFKPVS